MGEAGWTSLSLKSELVAAIDRFLEANSEGFSNRAEVIATAVRQFLAGQDPEEPARALLERTFRAVAATEPESVEELLRALLAELDMKVRHHAQAGTSKSNSESTKRR